MSRSQHLIDRNTLDAARTQVLGTTVEFLESDRFLRMVVQSLDQGIDELRALGGAQAHGLGF